MRSLNASHFIGFIVTLMSFGTSLRAETNWLTWANDFAQNYIALVASAESVSIAKTHSPRRFMNAHWQSADESERRLNRLVDKLISEEYSPYDIDTCIEQELAIESVESVKSKSASEDHANTEQWGIADAPFAYLRLASDCMERLDAEYRSLVTRSSMAFTPLQLSIEIVQELNLFKATKAESLVSAASESIDRPLDTKLANIFGTSVIPDFDLIAERTPAETATAIWEEVRSLAIRPYAVPRFGSLEFQSPQRDFLETRISKGSFESVR
jgi:hypothetical protein